MRESMPDCKCGQPSEGWPAKDGGELCQLCWEAESGAEWWDEVMAEARAALRAAAKVTPEREDEQNG